MQLNAALLRARRLQLGIPLKELMRQTGVSVDVLSKLEQTGDASELSGKIIANLLSLLTLDGAEALERNAHQDSKGHLAEELGSLLQSVRTRGVPIEEAVDQLDATLEQVESAASDLAERLRPSGLRLHRGTGGLSIVPAVKYDGGSRSNKSRYHFLSQLNRGDLVLLYRVLTSQVETRRLGKSIEGNVRLHKLEGANLVYVDGEIVKPTPELQNALI